MARKSRRRTRRRRKMRGGGMFDGVIAAAKGAGDGLKGMFGFNKEKEEQPEAVNDDIVRTNASDDLSQPAPEQVGGRRRRRRSRRKRRKSKRRRSRKRRRTRRRRRR